MAPPKIPVLSLLERLDFILRLGVSIPLRLAFHITRHVLIATWRGFPRRLYITCALMKVFLSGLTPRQLQTVNPSTRQMYETWVEKKVKVYQDHVREARLVHDIQELPVDESALLWLGNRRKATKFVLFFHGGGYVAPLNPGHLEWCWQAYVLQGAEQGVEVAVGILQYSLAPGGKYPVQLQQAVSAIGELLDSGVQPEDIVIGGDSAGGNLTMQLLGHILHPHSLIPTVELTQPLAGAFMVSPWVSQNSRSRSYIENTAIDLITSNLAHSLAASLFALPIASLPQQDQALAFPVDVEKPQFQGMSEVVKNVYVTAGKQELFLDQGVKLVECLRGCDKDVAVRFEVAEMEAHDFIVVEGANELVGSATTRMREWFKTIL